MDEKMHKHLRTWELQEKIMECFQTILKCEDELKEMRYDDLYDSGFNTIETLIRAIGLPKFKVCTHCFDGSSHF